MGNWHIRKFTNRDINQMISLFYQTVHSVNAKDYTKEQLDAWAPLEEIEQMASAWLDSFQDHMTYVAEFKDTIVGFSDMTDTGYLDRLYVHKDYQNLGIATSLVQKLESEAVKMQVEVIYTDASITAKPFFQHIGYIIESTQTVVRRGTSLVNYKMKKRLALYE